VAQARDRGGSSGLSRIPVHRPAQETIGRLGYRPYKPEILQRAGFDLARITLFPITAIARDWDDAQQKFFGENGIIDTVMKVRPS
jgi:ABC-type sulfate transport system substrate-binding protein